MNPEEEDITHKIYPVYRRKCESMGITVSSFLKATLLAASEGGKFDKFQIPEEELGPMQIRAVMEALHDLKYDKLKLIKIWKSRMGDQGLRLISKYLENVKKNTVDTLDIIDNDISHLGCEFLGKSLSYHHSSIKILKLDDNVFGTEGLRNLTIGLRANKVINEISLKYCGIKADGVKYLQQILANLHSRLKKFVLHGNYLGNQGIFELLRAVQMNEMLESLSIADTGLNLLKFVAKNIFIIEEGEENKLGPQEPTKKNENSDDEKEKDHENGLENVKEVVKVQQQNSPEKADENQEGSSLPTKKFKHVKQKTKSSKQETQEKQEEAPKCTKIIEENDKSIEAEVLRQLSDIMKNNLILSRYDIRFNPISDDAATILFEIIEENVNIKDIVFNTNVDNELRETLDTIMRRRTGRLPKGKRGGGGKTKKKK